MNTPPATRTCPHCARPIPSGSPDGLCPRCVLSGAATPTDSGTPGNADRGHPPSLAAVAAAVPSLEVLSLLGSGGMGFVFHAREKAGGREVALKVLPRRLAADPTFVERFQREARTLARLDHPGIVRVFDHGQSGGFCHLTMEYVDGANLRQALRAGGFTPEQALQIIPALCDALQYAHAHGVLHRDIKPENILLDSRGCVKIADFGIAKLLEDPVVARPDITLTQTGHRLGTPHYMAPEQVERPDLVDHRADIYSLGVVFYELLTGELPLGRFPAPSTKASLDARVDEIVFRALAKERELRQQSAGQVKDEVEGLATPSPATPPAGPSPVLATSPCFVSSPQHLRSLFAQFYIYSDAGTLTLEKQRLSFTGRQGTTLLSLSDILGISLGKYPSLTKPSGLFYVALRYRDYTGERILLLTPYTSAWSATWNTNPVVLDWQRRITEQVTMLQGRIPPAIDPELLRVPGPWKFLSIVAGMSAGAALLLKGILPGGKPALQLVLWGSIGMIGLGQAVMAWRAHRPKWSVQFPPRSVVLWIAMGFAAVFAAAVNMIVLTRSGGSGDGPILPPLHSPSEHRDSRPLVVFGPADPGTDPGAIVAASAVRSQSGGLVRTVALGDGSVQTVSEAEFLTRLVLAPAIQRPAVEAFLMGPKVPIGLAENRLRDGASLVRSPISPEEFHEVSVPLPEAFRQLSRGDPNLTMFALHALLRILPEDPDREFLFGTPSPENPSRRDLHLRTQSRHGGLLALLAILAARADPPQPGILEWAQGRGRDLWGQQPMLTICERRLKGDSDQDTEEILVDTREILALRPGQKLQFTVIRRTKSFGIPPQTHVVAFPWPRTP